MTQDAGAMRCAYCGEPVDEARGFFIVERRQGERVVAKGAACGPGCLIAVAHATRPRESGIKPRGALEETGQAGGAE